MKTLSEYKKYLIDLLEGKVSKSFLDYFIKARYEIGTIRNRRDGKYKKIRKDKWVKMYEGESKGKNIAVGKIKKQIENAKSLSELAEIIKKNRSRFLDSNGNIDKVVNELLTQVKDKRPEKQPKIKTEYENSDKKMEKKYREAKKILIDGGISEKKTNDILLKIKDVLEKTSNNIDKDISFIADIKNPNTRTAFNFITGIKLLNTIKGADKQIREFIGVELKDKKWLTNNEIVEIVKNNIGKNVVIDKNKREWVKGRESRTINPELVTLVGIENNEIVYRKNNNLYYLKIDNVRDIIINGKSAMNDKKNEDYAKDLWL